MTCALFGILLRDVVLSNILAVCLICANVEKGKINQYNLTNSQLKFVSCAPISISVFICVNLLSLLGLDGAKHMLEDFYMKLIPISML